MTFDAAVYSAPLSCTPISLRAMIEGRSDAWLDSRHDHDVLSPRETVAHLIVCEQELWIPRAKWIVEHPQPLPFPPADVLSEEALLTTHSVNDLLEQFQTLRQRSVKDLVGLNLSAEDLERQGVHPKFGLVKLSQLLATWVAHDLYHQGQIFKSFSALYVNQVGPWQSFLNLPHFN